MQDQQSGLDMERWLTPWRTFTYERPFTWEGNYLVSVLWVPVWLPIFTSEQAYIHSADDLSYIVM